jgi:hypothetical protein
LMPLPSSLARSQQRHGDASDYGRWLLAYSSRTAARAIRVPGQWS